MTQQQHKALAKKYAELIALRAMAKAHGAPQADIAALTAAIDEINALLEADSVVAKRLLA